METGQQEHERQRAIYTQRSETAMHIADQLGETQEEPRTLIYRIVKKLGVEVALSFLQRTQEVEATGGLLRFNGARRTPGGTFFYLLKTEGPPEGIQHLFPQKKKERRKEQASVPVSAVALPLTWNDRLAAIAEIREKGKATVKITLIGRPGQIVERETCIVTSMETNKIPSLPKGLPVPTNAMTTYTIYIAKKQWRKVAEAITDPDDVLIVEGFPHFDLEANSIAVFATNTTTKRLQIATRQIQQQKTDA